ncbi:hypothetical protein VNO77_03533 [Canavalia gladiata]
MTTLTGPINAFAFSVRFLLQSLYHHTSLGLTPYALHSTGHDNRATMGDVTFPKIEHAVASASGVQGRIGGSGSSH